MRLSAHTDLTTSGHNMVNIKMNSLLGCLHIYILNGDRCITVHQSSASLIKRLSSRQQLRHNNKTLVFIRLVSCDVIRVVDSDWSSKATWNLPPSQKQVPLTHEELVQSRCERQLDSGIIIVLLSEFLHILHRWRDFLKLSIMKNANFHPGSHSNAESPETSSEVLKTLMTGNRIQE